ncbi:LamG domain-containing protein [Candidatus Poribacteria bacterium]
MRNCLTTLLSFMLVFVWYQAVSAQDEATVLWYKFDEELGREVEDLSLHGNNGTIVGQIEFEPAGKIGGAGRFPPGTQIRIPISDSLNTEEELTIEFWVQCDPVPAATYWQIINKGWVGAGSYICGMDNNWMVLGYTWDINSVAGVRKDANQANAVVEETWQYYSATYDGEKIILWIDGELTVQTAAVGKINGGFDIVIAENFSGMLDEIRFSNVALDQDTIKEHMEGEEAGAVDARDKLTTTWAQVKSGK